jgi:hypothetical protein
VITAESRHDYIGIKNKPQPGSKQL